MFDNLNSKKVDLDEIETPADETLVALDDRVEGLIAKYVGKKKSKGTEHDEDVYKIYIKPGEGALPSIKNALLSRFRNSDMSKVYEYPHLVPGDAIHEDLEVKSNGLPNQPDKRVMITRSAEGRGSYRGEIDSEKDRKIANLQERLNQEKQEKKDAELAKTDAEIKSDLDDDSNDRSYGIDDGYRGGMVE